MLKHKLARGLLTCVLAAAGTMGFVGPSRAVVFHGTFDPPFGGTDFGDLYFSGTADFDMPAPCLLPGGGIGIVDSTCGAMSMIAASVTVSSASAAASATTNFSPPPPALAASAVVDNRTPPAQLLGIDMNPVLVGSFDTWFSSNSVWLEFDATFSPGDGELTAPSWTSDAYIYLCPPSATNCESVSESLRSNPAHATFTEVPEPATIGLVLAGIGGLAIAQRRRRWLG